MSVAKTHSTIAENPGRMGVTVAASGQELEADVQRKLKVWGVVEAFRDGRMPDNHQIDKVLQYAVEHSPVELNKLSPEGRVLIDDFRDIIETLRMIVAEKNADELFQEAVWASYAGDASRAKQSGVVPVSKDDAKADADQAAAHLRVLITLFLTNSEARKLLSDFGIIGRDIFASAAAKAADKARPDQEQLDKVDQEAPSNQWIGADGKRLGPNETPEVQVKGPDGSHVTYNPKDDPRDATVRDTEGNERSSGQVYDQAQEKKREAQQAKEEAKGEARQQAGGMKEQARGHAQDLNQHRDPNASLSQQKDQVLGRANEKTPSDIDTQNGNVNRNTGADKEEAKGQAREKGNQLLNKIPDEHRERAANAMQDTKQFFKEQLPEERRDQFIYRLKKVVVECQNHKDYQEAMTWMLDTLENYKGHAKHVANKGAQSAQAVADDPSIGDSTLRFRTLLERFANGRSLDGVTNALDQIYTDAQNDDHLRGYFSRLNEYIHRVLLEPGYILEDDSDREARQLQEDGKSFFTDKYKGHQQTLFDEIQVWFTSFNDDPLNRRFGDDLKRLFKDLLFNSEGNLSFKPKLWNDVRNVLLPVFIKQIGYVPIPRAEYSDDQIDLVIENLVLSGPNLFPNVVELEAHNMFKFSPYAQINKTMDTHHHRFRLGMSQIQADIRDVNFAFRRKKGWPKLSDHGLADVVIGGKGISISVDLETVENRRDSVFRVRDVDVDIDTLKWSIRDSKHDILYKFLKGTATGLIKKAIEAAVHTAIRTSLGHLDDQLVEIRNRVDDAKQSDETTRTQTLKDLYARKKDTAAQNAKKADEKTGTFKIIAGDRESSILPNMQHDASKSTSQRMFKVSDLAASGREWHSPAFDLLDKQHPAVTGQAHPAAKEGAGAQNTSAVQAARH
ncbi:hypothetical protein IAU60_004520 [Kwoniella sp. DSM 27419]